MGRTFAWKKLISYGGGGGGGGGGVHTMSTSQKNLSIMMDVYLIDTIGTKCTFGLPLKIS